MDLFKDLLPSLLVTKKRILEDEKDYNPFFINKQMSYYDDAIFYANQINQYPDIPKKAQYDYYFYALRSKKRPYVKWSKPITLEDLEAVKTYFGYNDAKGMNALNILTDEQIVMIRKITSIGE